MYASHTHRSGTKNGNDWEFANVGLSDGLSSYKVDVDFTKDGLMDKLDKLQPRDQVTATLQLANQERRGGVVELGVILTDIVVAK